MEEPLKVSNSSGNGKPKILLHCGDLSMQKIISVVGIATLGAEEHEMGFEFEYYQSFHRLGTWGLKLAWNIKGDNSQEGEQDNVG